MHRWLAVALVLGTVPGEGSKNASQLGTVPSVICNVRGDARARVFVLDQTPGTTPTLWRLSMRDGESGDRWVRLLLRGAQPRLAAGTASLTYKNANGGRMVTL